MQTVSETIAPRDCTCAKCAKWRDGQTLGSRRAREALHEEHFLPHTKRSAPAENYLGTVSVCFCSSVSVSLRETQSHEFSRRASDFAYAVGIVSNRNSGFYSLGLASFDVALAARACVGGRACASVLRVCGVIGEALRTSDCNKMHFVVTS